MTCIIDPDYEDYLKLQALESQIAHAQKEWNVIKARIDKRAMHDSLLNYSLREYAEIWRALK